ncbi:hypothetical protein ACQWU4_14745 [Chryseobacterium sp. MIQD13]|uniref:hypothetical protein n=1 Tax=Chryseobacterium sp. MIQD13 TaxID=3422310 RepID=UPI003D29F647
MKSKESILVLLFVLLTVRVWSQIGINTDAPTAMLDVNGNLRLREAEKCIEASCADSLLVRNSGGYVQTVSRDQVFNSSGRSYVSGTGVNTTIPLVAISGLTNWLKIVFDKELIDEHNDFNISNNTFTAPKDGIYEVYVQMKVSSLVSLDDLGVGIFVKKGSAVPTLIAEETYTNVTVLTAINVSPPTRRTQTMVALNAGDQLLFGVKTTLVSLNLLSGTSSLFTIHQIK